MGDPVTVNIEGNAKLTDVTEPLLVLVIVNPPAELDIDIPLPAFNVLYSNPEASDLTPNIWLAVPIFPKPVPPWLVVIDPEISLNDIVPEPVTMPCALTVILLLTKISEIKSRYVYKSETLSLVRRISGFRSGPS